MNLKTLSKLLLGLLLLNSCQKNELDSQDIQIQSKSTQSELSMSADSSSVSSVQAKNVATLFLKKNPSTRATFSEKTVKSISELKNSNNTTAMYVINYNDDKGFVIISATKNYHPILAFSDTGHFDTANMPGGINEWVAQSTSIIENQKSDKAINLDKYRLEWVKYEKSEKPVITKGDTDLAALVRSSMDEWDSQGLQYRTLSSGIPDGMPDDIYKQFCDVAAGVANPDYDYLANSFILIKQDCQNTQYGPLLQTTWGQQNGFNLALPTIDDQYPPAGCTTIATSQVLNFYKWPANFDYANMANSYATATSQTFIRTVADAIGVKYGLNGTNASFGQVKDALINNFNFSPNIYYCDHNETLVINELKKSHPVLMGGFKTLVIDLGIYSISKDGHAWVCDGYLSSNTTITYSLVVLSQYEPLQYESGGYGYTKSSGWEGFHMNWGWSGAGNGYFNENDYSVTTYGETSNFKYDRKDFYNIYPNK